MTGRFQESLKQLHNDLEVLKNDDTKKHTPCDYPDYNGHYSCPFDANGSDDCRRFCGLGVDE